VNNGCLGHAGALTAIGADIETGGATP
jgi:hypothetical protein